MPAPIGNTWNTTHGQSKTRLFAIWQGMWCRCTNSRSKMFSAYGGSGITVCERWRSFEMFAKDMGERPDGHSLDRIDNDKGYSPGNCRWATRQQQSENRRSVRWLTHDGKTMTATAWARQLGISKSTFFRHLDAGKLAEFT